MPAEHFVPRFAKDLHASPRVQANALKALALIDPKTPESEWRQVAAAALMIGADWAGEQWDGAGVAKATGLQEKNVAKHYAELAEKLRHLAR